MCEPSGFMKNTLGKGGCTRSQSMASSTPNPRTPASTRISSTPENSPPSARVCSARSCSAAASLARQSGKFPPLTPEHSGTFTTRNCTGACSPPAISRAETAPLIRGGGLAGGCVSPLESSGVDMATVPCMAGSNGSVLHDEREGFLRFTLRLRGSACRARYHGSRREIDTANSAVNSAKRSTMFHFCGISPAPNPPPPLPSPKPSSILTCSIGRLWYP
mmetsp:Transcript_33188/g.78610  ORF Transcript_33188/g.78610 Transcript_33188/m.78610 type:complete len:219 (-) Transcript_33188:37-693(-)